MKILLFNLVKKITFAQLIILVGLQVLNAQNPVVGNVAVINEELPTQVVTDNTLIASKTQNATTNLPSQHLLSIYPNPCQSHTNINYTPDCQIDTHSTNINILIYNSNGQLTCEQYIQLDCNELYSKNINVSNWQKGVYYCAIYQNETLQKVESFLKL